MRREEIEAVYAAGREAVVELVEGLLSRIDSLTARVDELERHLGQHSQIFDVTQRMSDDPLTNCTACEAPVQRVFHPVAVHFKGSGFYTTDYRRAGSSEGSEASSAPVGGASE